IRPRVLLDEWQRLGIVHVDEHDRVCLDVQGFVPARGSDEMAYFFGRNLHDHTAAAVSNMLGAAEPFFERGVNYGRLSAASVEDLAERARHGGTELLRGLNTRAAELQARDAGGADASQRINVGVYLFHDEPADEPEETK